MSYYPFFTIIIPTYNRAHIIKRPIDSIISQSFDDWELIIVDDGSTDDTKAVVDTYRDSRIKYVWQENQERSAARNHGISLAKGEWICFQDSDDEYLPEHLRILHDGIIQFPEYRVFRTGMLIYQNGSLLKIPKFDVENDYELYPFDAFQTFTIASQVIKQIRFNVEYFNSEDMHLLIRINAYHDIKVIKKFSNIYHYNVKNSGGTGLDYYRIHTNKIKVFQDLLRNPGTIKVEYLKRKLCLSTLLIFIGHLKHSRNKIILETFEVVRTFFMMPYPFAKLLFRIIIVKFCEWTGIFNFSDRY